MGSQIEKTPGCLIALTSSTGAPASSFVNMAGSVTSWFDNLHPDNLGHQQAANTILAALD
jgi:hypothetical protein